MKNNLIPFPKTHQLGEDRKKSLPSTDEVKALRAAFDRVCADWPLEAAELPENNKMYNGLKK
ncbi:hypothetical protein [Marinomonas colpomeniae]|uniref:Uncharacterized protein n=1 Tax=Marinomonas colpomeniae TaxID=2774408 RepID=A0ABR8P382_9GAMM|nr:hypothetical protein [Marinomonas colpomeniae]MBD5772740.1 hypothetical protein [Marinomonas colpomeniae]